MIVWSAGSDMSLVLDQEGFLCHLDEWNETIAMELAARECLSLTDAHWEIIHLVRRFYQRYEHSPEMRPLVKFTRQELDAAKGQSVYLLSLFPNSPAKLACKIAGLPRPANCL